ncbi:MAG: OpgC domain-containing protein [Planctomycetes bacterium]|nr:OpgC domain-containing protein [Planctomycetota bacterium]
MSQGEQPTGDVTLRTPGAGRDERIDFWRGLCILGMVSWHLLTDPSYPTWFSFGVIQPFNFVAEGFVLVAGLVIGLGAARHAEHSVRVSHYLRRALQLLLLHYAVVVALGLIFGASCSEETATGADWVRAILLLEYQPYLGDILSVFVFLFAATPIFLVVQRACGRWALLALSLAVYLAGNLATGGGWSSLAALELNRYGAFDFNTWQFVFVLGLLLGGRFKAITAWGRQNFRPCMAVCVGGFALAFAYRLAVLSGRIPADTLPQSLDFSRHPLTIARLGYVGLQVALIGLLTVRFWDRLADGPVVRWIVMFGRRSLVVFVVSVFLDYALKAAILKTDLGFPANLTIWAAELAALDLVARYGRLPRRHPSR